MIVQMSNDIGIRETVGGMRKNQEMNYDRRL